MAQSRPGQSSCLSSLRQIKCGNFSPGRRSVPPPLRTSVPASRHRAERKRSFSSWFSTWSSSCSTFSSSSDRSRRRKSKKSPAGFESKPSQASLLLHIMIFFALSLFFTIFGYFCQIFFSALFCLCSLFIDLIYYAISISWHQARKAREEKEKPEQLRKSSGWWRGWGHCQSASC